MVKRTRSRHRLQIELRPNEERLVERLRAAYGENESEAGRRLLMLFDRLADVVASGAVLTALPAGDERAIDAIPELTAAMRPEATRYTHPTLGYSTKQLRPIVRSSR